MVAGDFNFSAQPSSRLTVVNNTSVSNLRINGPSSYTEINNGSNSGQTIIFRYLEIRTVTNSTDAHYRVKDWIGFYAGYRYTDRLVRTIEGFSIPAFDVTAPNTVYENTNHLHSGTVGVQLRPVKNLTTNLEGEVGRADNPLMPVSDGNYHTLNELPHAEGAVIDLLQAGVQRERAGGVVGVQFALAELLGECKLGAEGLVHAGCGLHEAASGYGKWDRLFRGDADATRRQLAVFE
jgi:hypothetical protein